MPPTITGQERPRFRSADEWATRGVRVQKGTGDLPRTERETNVSFIEAEQTAEVMTCRASWMRRMESSGAVPQSIQTYDDSDGEFRWYIVPKNWVKMPYPNIRDKATYAKPPGRRSGSLSNQESNEGHNESDVGSE